MRRGDAVRNLPPVENVEKPPVPPPPPMSATDTCPWPSLPIDVEVRISRTCRCGSAFEMTAQGREGLGALLQACAAWDARHVGEAHGSRT